MILYWTLTEIEQNSPSILLGPLQNSGYDGTRLCPDCGDLPVFLRFRPGPSSVGEDRGRLQAVL